MSVAMVCAAPFLGKTTIDVLKSWLSGPWFVRALSFAVAAGFFLLLALAARHLRRAKHRRRGFLWILAGAALVALWISFNRRGSASEAAIERFHLLVYATIGFLWARALRSHGWWGRLAAWFLVALAGIADEGIQWLVPVRTGELFDVGLNVYAGLAGIVASLGVFSAARRLPASTEDTGERDSGRRLAVVCGAVLVFAAGVFVDFAHLGYEIEDVARELTFPSYFTAARLARLDEQHGERWARQPPQELGALEKEDYFRTEAGWRVQARNEARERGDFGTALGEQRILEAHYRSFLNVRLGGVQPFALPTEERAQLLAAAGPDALQRAYRSAVRSDRVWVHPSRRVWWSLVAWSLAAAFFWLWRDQKESLGTSRRVDA